MDDSAIRSAIWGAPLVVLGEVTMVSLASYNDDGVSGEDLLVSPHGELYRFGWWSEAVPLFHRSLDLITQSEAQRIHEEIISSPWREWPEYAPRNGCYVDMPAIDAFDECARRLLSGEEVEFPFPPDEITWDVDCQDLRASPDLAQAALDRGIAHITMETADDGRRRIVLRCGLPDTVRVFVQQWAPAQGLTDVYGDPARGIAGGYELPTHTLVGEEDQKLVVALADSELCKSRAEARRLIVGGGVRVNGERVQDPDYVLSPGDLGTEGAVVRVGKKRAARLVQEVSPGASDEP